MDVSPDELSEHGRVCPATAAFEENTKSLPVLLMIQKGIKTPTTLRAAGIVLENQQTSSLNL
jgi:hypothetical protein